MAESFRPVFLLVTGEAVLVALGGAEIEHVHGGEVGVEFPERIRVEQMAQALARADAEMVFAMRADALVFLQFDLVQDCTALRAGVEQTAGDLELLAVAGAAAETGFAENGHGTWKMEERLRAHFPAQRPRQGTGIREENNHPPATRNPQPATRNPPPVNAVVTVQYAHARRARPAQHPGAFVDGRAGRVHVVHQEQVCAGHRPARDRGERAAQVTLPFLAREMGGLRPRRAHPSQRPPHGQARLAAHPAAERLGLVEAAFALAPPVQRHGHQRIHRLAAQAFVGPERFHQPVPPADGAGNVRPPYLKRRRRSRANPSWRQKCTAHPNAKRCVRQSAQGPSPSARLARRRRSNAREHTAQNGGVGRAGNRPRSPRKGSRPVPTACRTRRSTTARAVRPPCPARRTPDGPPQRRAGARASVASVGNRRRSFVVNVEGQAGFLFQP